MFGKTKSTELDKFYDDFIKDFKEGEIVKGKIVSLTAKEALIDIGYKSEGYIALSEFSNAASLKVGEEVDVLLETKESEEGTIVLSKWKADRKMGWERIMNEFNEGDIIEGRVSRKVKGGLMVDIGLEAFLPASLVALRGFSNLGQYIGQTFKFKIVKINKPRRNVVLSRKDILRQEQQEARNKLIHELKKGETRAGVVKNITD
ncbi:MAG: S1 RNA-binding domain-containing protein, partial [Candidatus Omnitrophica bacterium]|nr:S1 RNA-binding domain-containing protein [Candidatus Omnitrophota bacterium]